ncbi:amino acid permease [Parasphingopyxis algicola]|uniref:APC family permease n=1 Tax=Parasphingopyxis algicola TaxID=2026624 RepID=UPI0015A04240|nr:APC family permease [Parasphingopyxis algicola]QLC25104.1 amino acid permease [Parasphingopyxis algicola]
MPSSPADPAPLALRRSVTGPLLVLYGVGTMIGAGIYALIGEVAAAAGLFAPLSFLLASLIAALTAASFAELAARYPQSAGEAAYVSAAFAERRIALLVGLLIIASGIVSSGVMFRGFAGYAGGLVSFEPWHAYLGLALLIGGLASWGIGQSVLAIAAITIVEVGAILFVIALGVVQGIDLPDAPPAFGSAEVAGVVAGAVLAFYAFIGFEDMVNIAEEVKRPRRTLPIAILLALLLTALIYIALAVVAIGSTSTTELARSTEPMTLILSQLTDAPSRWMSYVAMLAVLNGALVQVVMASRVLFGLSRQRLIAPWFGRVHPRTRTPIAATLLVIGGVFAAAVLLPLATLAQFTAMFLLIVFALVNVALIRVRRMDMAPPTHFTAPRTVPHLGAATATLFALASGYQIVS